MLIFITICALSTSLNLCLQRREKSTTAGVFKLIAASCYVGLAIYNGATESLFGRLLLAAFVLSWLGDACLIRRGQSTIFLAGIYSFLLAHLAFSAGFWVRGLQPQAAVVAFGVIVLLGFGVLNRLDRNGLRQKMRAPVAAYVSVIGLMVSFAVGTSFITPSIAIAGGAVLFVISDLFVARERFVKPAFINIAAGQSLYFMAQLFLASSIV